MVGRKPFDGTGAVSRPKGYRNIPRHFMLLNPVRNLCLHLLRETWALANLTLTRKTNSLINLRMIWKVTNTCCILFFRYSE